MTIHSATMARMIEFDLYIDDVFVYTQSSDGLIVSSPTGSTAYALSAGGPIMHPSLNAIALVPMFPHSLNSRPLVVPGDSELRITLGEKLGAEAKVSFDSQLEFRLHPGESVRVKKASEAAGADSPDRAELLRCVSLEIRLGESKDRLIEGLLTAA